MPFRRRRLPFVCAPVSIIAVCAAALLFYLQSPPRLLTLAATSHRAYAGLPWRARAELPLSGGTRALVAWVGGVPAPTSAPACGARDFASAASAALGGLRRASTAEIGGGTLAGVRVIAVATLEGASEAADAALVEPPRMLPATITGMCAVPPAHEPSFQFSLRPSTCGADAQPPAATFASPWCLRPSLPASIVSAECAWLESYVQDDWAGPVTRIISGSILLLNTTRGTGGGGVILADALLRDGRPAALWPKGGPPPASGISPVHVHEHALLATPGPLRCSWCPGHFFNEALPLLLLLDALLPLHIPLLWPGGSVPEGAARALRRVGSLSTRRIVLEPREPALHHVQRLFFFRDTGAVSTSWLAQRYASRVLRAAVAVARAPSSPPPLVVVIALRQGASTRVLKNLDAVLSTLDAVLPGVEVDAFTPDADLLRSGARFARACLLIGVHGANLADMLFMRPGCSVIELGTPDIFSDYACLARNLGLRYWLSLGEGGHGVSAFAANTRELREVLEAIVREGGLEAPQSNRTAALEQLAS